MRKRSPPENVKVKTQDRLEKPRIIFTNVHQITIKNETGGCV